MAQDPKLEIFKLRLRNKDKRPTTLRELLRRKFKEYPPKNYPDLQRPITPQAILSILYIDLIHQIDKEGFNKNEAKKKAFTLASEVVDGTRFARYRSYSRSELVHGVL